MGKVANFIIVRIVTAICTLSIAKGILLWLAGKEIYPDRWINTMIGLAEGAVTANPAGTWVLLGLAGLLGLAIGPSIYNWGTNKFGRKPQQVNLAPSNERPLKYLECTNTELSNALLTAGMQMSWGKRYKEQCRGTEGQKILSTMGKALLSVLSAAQKGDLEIRGQISGTTGYEVIPQDTLKHVGLIVTTEHQQNVTNPFKVKVTAASGVPPDPKKDKAIEKVSNYDSLDVNSRQFEALIDSLSEEEGSDIAEDSQDAAWRISLGDLCKIAEKKGWDFADDETGHVFDLRNGLKQAGIDGRINIWGRKIPRLEMDVDLVSLTKIPAKYWEACEIDPFTSNGDCLGSVKDNLQIRTHHLGFPHYEGHYADLHVDREQAEKWLRLEAEYFKGRTKKRMDIAEKRRHGAR